MPLFKKKTGVEAFVDGVGRTANGFVAGLAAGAIASWAMNQYQAIEGKPVAVRKREAAEAASAPQSNGIQSAGTGPQQQKAEEAGSENATVVAAQAVSRNLFEHDLKDEEKAPAGAAVHYGYGAAVGGLYGGLAEVVPTVGLGLGIPYATLLWLLGDEIAVPALGLGKSPTETPASGHASSLAAHFVYGATLDISRRILKHII